MYLGNDLVAEIQSNKAFTLDDLDVSVTLESTPNGVTTYSIGPNDGARGIDVTGSSGNDRIIGDIGDDTISGGCSSDVLEGGAGNDRLIGDGGSLQYLSLDDDYHVSVESDTLFGGTVTMC